jgi:hypothetical protein
MSFPFSDKFSYVKDRFVNALWMIRNGKLDLIVKSIYIEVSHRVMQLKVLLLHGRNPDYSKLPGSAYINKCKVIPPSYRPTVSRQSPLPVLQVDKQTISNELNSVLSGLLSGEKSQS